MPEQTDIQSRGLAVGAAIVLAGIVISIAVGAFIATRLPTPAIGPSTREDAQRAQPRLQTDPQQDIAAFKREKNARLESTGRVDDTHVRIPIEQAMQILAKRQQR